MSRPGSYPSAQALLLPHPPHQPQPSAEACELATCCLARLLTTQVKAHDWSLAGQQRGKVKQAQRAAQPVLLERHPPCQLPAPALARCLALQHAGRNTPL